jgi:hypothetical protein
MSSEMACQADGASSADREKRMAQLHFEVLSTR